MSADLQNVENVLRFALLTAGEADEFRDRQLGPIHLIKYVYLADLAFAKRHEGQTYTGVAWQFYHFGPWAPVVLDTVEPALVRIGANKMSLPSDYGDKGEWVRWSLRRDDLVADLERILPAEIVASVRTCVKKFGSDTPALLDHVYRTAPMLNASPGEFLDLSLVNGPLQERQLPRDTVNRDVVSVRRLKKIKERFAASRSKAASAERKAPKLINPAPDARFDAIYLDGLEWTNKIAGKQLPEGESSLEFAAEVWKSPTRSEHDPS